MTFVEFDGLKAGDLVRNKLNKSVYTVAIEKVGYGPIVASILNITNPDEWELFKPANGVRVDLALKDDFVRDQIREAIAELKAEWDKRYGQRAPDYNH